MIWTPPIRNWPPGPEGEAIQAFEAPFIRFHDGLADAYYNHWRHGFSKPFHQWDVGATPEESLATFRKLEAWLSHKRDLAEIERTGIDPITDEGIPRSVELANKLAALAAEGYHIADADFY